MDIIMDANTANSKSYEKFLKLNANLILEYIKLINDRILESIDKGQSYYGDGDCFPILFQQNKFSKISDIVEAKFEKEGYKFKKGTYAGYFRWDDKKL